MYHGLGISNEALMSNERMIIMIGETNEKNASSAITIPAAGNGSPRT